jgi:hypothetical protein
MYTEYVMLYTKVSPVIDRKKTKLAAIRAPAELVDLVDRLAESEGATRSQIWRTAAAKGLEALGYLAPAEDERLSAFHPRRQIWF